MNSVDEFLFRTHSSLLLYAYLRSNVLFGAYLKKLSSVIFCLFALSGCGIMSSSIGPSESINTSKLTDCANNIVTTDPCQVSTSGKVVTDDLGHDITSWSNISGTTSVSGTIPNGFYSDQYVRFTDLNLLSANIVNGVSIFGVIGTATGPYAACNDSILNSSQCSTASSRYVYASQNGGRSADCSAGSNAAACWTNSVNQYVTGTAGTNISGVDGSLSAAITTGYYSGSQTATMSDGDLLAGNIRSGVNIFGVLGSFTGTFALNMSTGAHRDPGVKVIPNLADLTTTSLQLTLNDENTTYAGSDFPTTSGYRYRDIPDLNQDDDGYYGTNCKYATRPSVNCGTSQATIALRAADCQALNPSSSSWSGAAQCNGGQGVWRLVVRSGANKEVWQDQRTGLLWSSIVNSAVNWCRATGNTQLVPLVYVNSFNNTAGTPITGNGTIGTMASGTGSNTETVTITFSDAITYTVTSTGGAGGCQGGTGTGGLSSTAGSTDTYSDVGECSFTITQGTVNFAANDKFVLQSVANASYSCAPGGPLQLASPVSYCAEEAGLNAGAGDDWLTPIYMTAKGGLGKGSTPGVRWRTPSINDYKLADINGIRFVMPDMGIGGANRPTPDNSIIGASEWSSTGSSTSRLSSWIFFSGSGSTNLDNRLNTYGVRCVGR